MAKKKNAESGVLKKKDLSRLRDGLKAVESSGEYREAKFSYAVVKTLRLVEIEIRDLKRSNAWSDEYREFDKEQGALAKKYAKKDKEGNPKVHRLGDKVGIEIDNSEAYNAGVEKLKKKHAKAVKEQDEKDAKHKKFLEEPAEVKIHTISKSLMPKDISAKHLNGIFELFED